MNTKEAIELIKQGYICNEFKIEIIEILQHGKKYEVMWKDLENFFNAERNMDLLHMNSEDFIITIKAIKRTYFPEK